jgi:hypothetical protein
MAEHELAPAATSKSLNKALWLAALDALEQEFLAFQKRSACAGTVHADDLPSPGSANVLTHLASSCGATNGD